MFIILPLSRGIQAQKEAPPGCGEPRVGSRGRRAASQTKKPVGGRKCQGHKDSFWVCRNWCFNVYVEQLGTKKSPTKPQPAAWPRIGLASFNLSISEAQRLPWSAGIWSQVLGNCYVSNLMYGSWCPSPGLLVKSHPHPPPSLPFLVLALLKRHGLTWADMGWSRTAFNSFRDQLACVTPLLLELRGVLTFSSRGYNDA